MDVIEPNGHAHMGDTDDDLLLREIRNLNVEDGTNLMADVRATFHLLLNAAKTRSTKWPEN